MSEHVDALTERMATFQQRARARGREGRHQRMRDHLLEWSDVPAARGLWGRWAWPAAATALMVVLGLVWALRPRPLTFEVGGRVQADATQAFFSASDDEPLALSFSDGSAVVLRPGARVRVAALRDDTAGLVLESGAADMQLRSSSSAWSVEAGPYRVRTLGADLTVRWVPEAREFALELRGGRARIDGPGIDGSREAFPGEPVVLGGGAPPLRLPSSTPLELAPPTDDGARVPSTQPTLPVSEAASSRRSARRSGRRTKKPSVPAAHRELSSSWQALARRGKHARAFAAADAAGFSTLTASLGSSALLELADVARYARRSTRAQDALKALRRRFPGTDDAAMAAFDLGRLTRRCAGATRWFRTYLDERPRGSMAVAARQRLDECVVAGGEGVSPAP